MSARKLRFGVFEMDLATEELFRDGKRVKREPIRATPGLSDLLETVGLDRS